MKEEDFVSNIFESNFKYFQLLILSENMEVGSSIWRNEANTRVTYSCRGNGAA